MLGTYFYHEILRKTVIGFGTLFNNINIRHKDASGTNFSVMKVPGMKQCKNSWQEFNNNQN